MEKRLSSSFKENLIFDLPASLVVFLVAVPLCLGIALASGAPMAAGLISGAIGGIVVGYLSGSPLSISGPAAGLTSIVLVSIAQLGSFQAFAVALVIAGIIQILLGYLKVGTIGYLAPSSVVKGMLAGIGMILILKQIPHALGDDMDYEGDEAFFQPDNQNTLTEIIQSVMNLSVGAVIITLVSIVVLIFWGSIIVQRNKILKQIPAPLMVVGLGILFTVIYNNFIPSLQLSATHMVNLPHPSRINEMFSFPDWNVLKSTQVYGVALTLALVASIETLLCIESADKMDPFKRVTPLNQELKAQGAANMLCGLVGGLPVTSVVVRTTANISAGARTKASSIFHGIWIVAAVLIFPSVLEYIPLASLAAILIMVGYKLASKALWKEMFAKGKDQFLPFAVTATVILFSNLLVGIAVGILVSIFFVLKSNYRTSILTVNQGDRYLIKFTRDTSFINKLSLIKAIEKIPNNTNVLMEGSNVQFFDQDIIEAINDFQKSAPTRNITIEIKKTKHALHPFFQTT